MAESNSEVIQGIPYDVHSFSTPFLLQVRIHRKNLFSYFPAFVFRLLTLNCFPPFHLHLEDDLEQLLLGAVGGVDILREEYAEGARRDRHPDIGFAGEELDVLLVVVAETLG